jgi:hypothetical protein
MKYALLLWLGLSAIAKADILIYSGSSTGKVTGLGSTYKVVTQSKIVVDMDTGFRAAVGWFTLKGQKLFSVDTIQPFRPTIIGAGGLKITVAAYGFMGYDTNGYFHVRNGFGRGVNTVLAITPNRRVDFPAIFQTTEQVVQAGPNGSVAVEGKGVTTFLQAATQASNARGETLPEAIDRFTANIQAQGYTFVAVPE